MGKDNAMTRDLMLGFEFMCVLALSWSKRNARAFTIAASDGPRFGNDRNRARTAHPHSHALLCYRHWLLLYRSREPCLSISQRSALFGAGLRFRWPDAVALR